MNKQLAGFNIVITANNFNPTIFNQVWLTKNNLITEADLNLQGNVFTEAFTQISAENFVIVITPQQLQFIPKFLDKAFDTISTVLIKLISLIPQTPFITIDVNFEWHLNLETNTHEYTKSKFWSDTNPFLKHFNSDDCNYGYYISRDMKEVEDVRLKLNIRPVLYTQLVVQPAGNITQQPPSERLQLAFNYHKDYKSQDIEIINKMLLSWNLLYSDSEKTTELLINS